MKRFILLVFTTQFLLINSHGQNIQTESSALPDTAFVPTDSTQYYFPMEVFNDTTMFE